jgi:hypothetical protein
MLVVKSMPYYFDLNGVLKNHLTFKTTRGTSIRHTTPFIREKKKSLVLTKTELDAELNYANEVWYY